MARKQRRWRGGWAAGVALVVLWAAQAGADGVYFPEVVTAKAPEIPVQRALLVHREGQERLVIESALKSEGLAFGWVIPLPAAPTEMSPTTTGALDTLRNVIQPRITHDRMRTLPAVAWMSFMCVLAAVMVARKPEKRLTETLAGISLLVVLCIAGKHASSSAWQCGRAGHHAEGR